MRVELILIIEEKDSCLETDRLSLQIVFFLSFIRQQTKTLSVGTNRKEEEEETAMYTEKRERDYLHEHKKNEPISMLHERIQFFVDGSFNDRFPLNILFTPLRGVDAGIFS